MIAEFESRILALIDNMVDHASDDEPFAGGYLRGHLTLAVAELEAVSGRAFWLTAVLSAELARAWRKPSALARTVAAGPNLVQGMWHNLYQQAKNQA